MKECLEEGIVQAYVDGELSPLMAEKVMKHAAGCAACAALVAEAENELSILATAFEPELSAPVPSERLRQRLDAAIAEVRAQRVAPEKAAGRNLKEWLASLAAAFNFTPRHAVGFASLIAVVAFAVIFAIVASRRSEPQPQLANVGNEGSKPTTQTPAVPNTAQSTPTDGPVSQKVNYPKPVVSQPRRARASARPQAKVDGGAVAQLAEKPLPGEVSYLKTIASLTSVIEANGENAIKPSLRANYERNLALVDHAIDATRRTARRNPKDPDATEFLYSSYQSKIDLLSTVAEQGQMVAVAR